MDSKNKQELLQKAKNSTDNGLLIQISATFLSEGLFEEAWKVQSHRKGLLKDDCKAPYPRKGCLKKLGMSRAIGRGC